MRRNEDGFLTFVSVSIFMYFMTYMYTNLHTIYPGVFFGGGGGGISHNFKILNCFGHFLQFEKFLVESNTGYDFCVFNDLRL